MLTKLIVALALAIGIALPHGHAGGATVHGGSGHVSAADSSGGGPPMHP